MVVPMKKLLAAPVFSGLLFLCSVYVSFRYLSKDQSLPSISPLPVHDKENPLTSFRSLVYTANDSLPHWMEHQATLVGTCRNCQKWGVMNTKRNTSFSVSVSRFLKLDGWCVVIVYSGNTPKRNSVPHDSQKCAVYLNSLPGDKNAGYLYAISRGATAIWDFDDDHMLKFWVKGAAPRGAPSLDEAMTLHGVVPEVDAMEPLHHTWPTYNPYPVLGAPVLPSWPRGLPINDVRIRKCSTTGIKRVTVESKFIGVLQSLSDYRPDADKVYDTVVPIPFFFIRSTETRPLVVPKGIFSPYNSQCTLHFQPALWALYLPVTVEEGLRDVWRSYIAQRLYWDAGLKVGFLPRPLVVHSSDSLRGGNDATQEGYHKTQLLVNFLLSWRCHHKLLIDRIEQLWHDLYLAGLVGHQDVAMVREWLQHLENVGYAFPPILSRDNTGRLSMTAEYISSQDPVTTAKWLGEIINQSIQRVTHKCNSGVKTIIKNTAACRDNTSLTFWTSDIHFGTRIDIPSTLDAFGQKVVLAISDNESRHPEVWKKRSITIYKQVSDVIKKSFTDTSCMNTRLTEQMIQSNFEFYRNDTVIKSTDAFVCLFQPGMCEMWMPFNRTIIFVPAHRYSMGRCTKEEFERLNEHLFALASMDNPKHIIAASSVYDLEQLYHYTGLDVLPLFSYSGHYVGTHPYNPTRPEIPIFIRSAEYWNDGFTNKVKKFTIVDVKKLYPWFQFSDLVNHRAVIYLPYAVMSYKITELYALNIPLLFPSMKYLQTIKGLGADRSILAGDWCGGGYKAIGNLKDSEMKPHPCSTHPYSPNLQASEDMEAEYYWLQFADFFVWPHITYFDDFEDLERKLENTNFTAIHNLMVVENQRRVEALRQNWCYVYSKIKPDMKVPQNYTQAIKELYGVDRLQVY